MADVGTLTAKLTLDTAEFSQGASEVEGLSDGLATKVTGALGGVAATVGAAVAAAAAAVGSLVKESVSNFAEYQQLVGGVETMFQGAAGTVQAYAEQAFQTAGVSANQYMEQVTSFSASLIASLNGDTAAAAETANMAITDMADNANKMGTTIESLQSAYQGFAKQNYTMLDNLKLGYGGTRTEMERLLADAEKFSGIHYDINNLNDVYNAIHVIQDELGITGTTAQEAGSTISGSFASVKAAWDNVLTSIAGGGPALEKTVAEFATTVSTFVDNIIPTIATALGGVGQLIQNLAPIIAAELPGLIESVLPQLLEAVMTMANGIVAALPQILSTILSAITSILPGLFSAFVSLIDSLLTSIIPQLLVFAIQFVLAIAKGITDNIQNLMDSLVNLINFIVNTLIENLPLLLEVGMELILAIVKGIAQSLPQVIDTIVSAIPQIVDAWLQCLPIFLQIGTQIILEMAKGILLAIPRLIGSFLKAIGVVEDTAKDTQHSVSDIMNTTYTETTRSVDRIQSSLSGMNNNVSSDAKQLLEASDESARQLEQAADQITNKSYNAKIATSQSMNGIMIAAQAAQSSVAKEFTNMANSVWDAASSISSACASINASFSSIRAPSISMGGVSGGRASGGSVGARQTYLVGEQGPELFTPSSSGYIYNSEETADMLGGQGGISIVIQGDVYDDERSMRNKLRDAILDVMEAQFA